MTTPGRTSLAAMLLVSLTALAGCVGSPTLEAADTAGAEVQAPVSLSDATVTLTGCREWHTVFSASADGFQDDVPEGFEIATTDPTGQTVDVLVFIAWCHRAEVAGPAGTTVATDITGTGPEAIGRFEILLPVIPPDDLIDEAYLFDWISLGSGVSLPAVTDLYRAWGLPEDQVLDGRFHRLATLDSPTVLSEGLTFTTDEAAYRVDSTVRRDAGAFQPELSRLWTTASGQVTGAIVVESSASETVGLGSATWTYQGPDDDVPPVVQGISHTVRGVTETLTYQALDR